MQPITIGNSPSSNFGSFQSPGGGVDWNTVFGGPLNPSNNFGGLLGNNNKQPLGNGQPLPPGFSPIIDMNSLQGELNAIPVDMSGIDAFRSQALRTGPSTWANLAKTTAAAQEANQKEQAKTAANSNEAQADDQLAMSGGLSSGARERVAEGGATNSMQAIQDLTRQGNINDLQIGENDEQNRISQLGSLPGMENQAIAPLFQKASILTNAQEQEQGALNNYNQNLYDQQMSAWAANQQAIATENASKK